MGASRLHGYWHFLGLQVTVPDVEIEPFTVRLPVPARMPLAISSVPVAALILIVVVLPPSSRVVGSPRLMLRG